MLLGYNVLDMFIPVKLLVYLNSKIFYSSTNFNLLTTYLKGKMLSDLFSLRTVYYQFSLICIQTDLVRSQQLNNKGKIMINVFIYSFHGFTNVEKVCIVYKV